MSKLLRIVLMATLLCLSTALAAAQNSDKPTIAILRYGSMQSISLTEDGILDALESCGIISAEENQTLLLRQDFEGDCVNIAWGDAAATSQASRHPQGRATGSPF